MSALPGWWRWEDVPGARYVASRASPLDSVSGRVPDDPPRGWRPYPGAMPCESDPATIGCLTARVREICNDPTVTATCRRRLRIPGDATSGWEDGPWSVTVSASSVTIEIASGPTEWSALMAAGDAAWARKPTTSPTTPQGEP